MTTPYQKHDQDPIKKRKKVRAVKNSRFVIGANDSNRRIDRVVRTMLPQVPLSRIYAAIRKGEVTHNGARVSLGTTLSLGDTIEIASTLLEGRGGPWQPANRTKDFDSRYGRVLYTSPSIVAIHKWRGVLLFGPESCQEEVRRWLYVNAHKSWGLAFKPAALHRIDRNTSGVVLFAANLPGAQEGSALMRAGKIEKKYLALLHGVLTGAQQWCGYIQRDTARKQSRALPLGAPPPTDARYATTHVAPLVTGSNATLVLCTIRGGRTHQIRAHAAAHHHPLVGDIKYGGGRGHYFLHAYSVVPDSPLFPPITAPPTRAEVAQLCRLAPLTPGQVHAAIQEV